MNDNYIKCGHYYMNGKKYQIVIDENYLKDYFEEKEENGTVFYLKVSEEERNILNEIFNPPFDGTLYVVKSNKSKDNNLGFNYLIVLNFFINTIEENFSDLDVDVRINFNENIRTLKIIDNQPEKLSVISYAEYRFPANKIYLRCGINKLKSANDAFLHEVIHLWSANIRNKTVGFFDTKNNYGLGVNEFATEYLAHKLFGCRKGYFDEFDNYIIDNIILIIGYKNFVESFIKGGHQDLISHLSTHFGCINAKKLLGLIDNYYHLKTREYTRKMKVLSSMHGNETDSQRLLNEIYKSANINPSELEVIQDKCNQMIQNELKFEICGLIRIGMEEHETKAKQESEKNTNKK